MPADMLAVMVCVASGIISAARFGGAEPDLLLQTSSGGAPEPEAPSEGRGS